MRNLLTALLAVALAAPGALLAQTASAEETKAVTEIVECLLEGLPEDWVRAEMKIELAQPGADTGDVLYMVARGDSADKLQAFTPCDVRKPARAMLELRKTLPMERRPWIAATLLLQRDGKFGLNYDYPKK
jgi:hypothetical protein